MIPTRLLTLSLLLVGTVPLSAQDPRPSAGLEITLESGTAAEQAAADQLRRIVDTYDLGRWTWTHRVHIEARQIPHSHPILTLNTRYQGDDSGQLATFLHEQFHWWAEARSDAVGAAVAEFRGLYPDVPVGNGQGGRDEESTYLHLIVCDLELQALAALLGEGAARSILASNQHYTWIYATVLDDPRVREINLRHGFDALLADASAP